MGVSVVAEGCNLFLELQKLRHRIRRWSQNMNSLQWLIGLLSDKNIITLHGEKEKENKQPRQLGTKQN